MKIKSFWFLLFLFQAFSAWPQYPSNSNVYYYGFNGERYSAGIVREFSSNSEAQQVVSEIVGAVGLKPNFIIRAAGVENAAAVIMGSQRLILYNPTFMQQVRQGTRTNWSLVSIVAHEIGHHLNGHTLDGAGSNHAIELEADEFSGYVLARMGASLSEAQAAMQAIASERGSSTHPPKVQRLQAIEQGWRNGGAKGADSARPTGGGRTTSPPSGKTTPSRYPQPLPRTDRPAPPPQHPTCPDDIYYDPERGYYIRSSRGGVEVIIRGSQAPGRISTPSPSSRVRPYPVPSNGGWQPVPQQQHVIRQGGNVVIYSRSGRKPPNQRNYPQQSRGSGPIYKRPRN